MALSKRQKALVGLCAAAAVAVGYDRLSSKASDVPSHSTIPVAAAALTAPSEAAAASNTEVSLLQQRATIAQRLRDVAGKDGATENLRDVFQPGAPWVAHAAPAAAAETSDRVNIEEFLKQHSLRAILVSNGKRQAVIDSESFRVGDVAWDGFQVTAITEHTVGLTRGATTITLELSK